MEEERPKKKRKKQATAEEGGGKEHKKPWREEYATPAEIKAFLSDHIYLRHNSVKYRVEARLPPGDSFCQNSELAQFGLVCYEELDVMRPSQVNTMKSVVTMPAIDERKPYNRYPEHMPHVASFCGTGNNVQFLTDTTGNRRWIPFLVEHIDSPRKHLFNHEGIYAQAYALYRQGFRHYFSKAEEEMLKEHNRNFEMPQPEQEAISKHFRQPAEGEKGEFYSATDILGYIGGNPALRMTIEKIGSAMKALGFRQYHSHGRRGYRVVVYKPEEIEMNRRMLAHDAQPDDGKGDTGDS